MHESRAAAAELERLKKEVELEVRKKDHAATIAGQRYREVGTAKTRREWLVDSYPYLFGDPPTPPPIDEAGRAYYQGIIDRLRSEIARHARQESHAERRAIDQAERMLRVGASLSVK